MDFSADGKASGVIIIIIIIIVSRLALAMAPPIIIPA